jgi:MinD superfamily P-loop ATPase
VPEIVIISGKGGTGKTCLTGAFAHLSKNAVICDLDVDAPDLHLLLDPVNEQVQEFFSGHEAKIDPDKCTDCGECAERCRFGAVFRTDAGLTIDPLRCEGCGVCVHFCPAGAIDFPERHCGQWYLSQTRFGPLVHAQLFPGEENSGRLVTLLRQKARAKAEAGGQELILCDGAPGIGCPVISSLSGTDLAVVVTEPTPSGRHDLVRVADLCDHFRIPVAVIVNKYDLNPDQTRDIEGFCAQRGYRLLAELPFDRAVIEAMLRRQVVTEYSANGLAEKIRRAWSEIQTLADSVVTARKD